MSNPVFKKPGRGWHGDSASHKHAGAKGGKATARTHGKHFYAQIGSRGGKISGGNFKNNIERARIAGRKGGKSKGTNRRSKVEI